MSAVCAETPTISTLTLTCRFGDIHYFYGPPTDNPPHHRFDKGSYVYLFEDASHGRARLEVANHPGTDAQDAFDGCKPYFV